MLVFFQTTSKLEVPGTPNHNLEIPTLKTPT